LWKDNIADVLLMREALREFFHKPIDIVTVSDGEEALSMLDKQIEFDVVILDLNLPKVGGHAFLERYHPNYPPIVVFTSSGNPVDEKRAMALGAREFIRKPISYDGYVKAVCGIVQRWGNYKAASSGVE
jgi:CheY-like chemotaxis protein